MAVLGQQGQSLSDFGDGINVDTREVRSPSDIIDETQYNILTDALVKIENVLGANVDGTFASVELRLADFLTRIAALEAGGGGGPSGGITQRQPPLTTVVPCAAGQSVLVVAAPAVFPANCRAIAVFAKNVGAIGTSGGMTSYSVGSHGIDNRWGDTIPPTNDNKTNIGHFFSELPISNVQESVRIFAINGTFDGTGSIEINIEYEIGEAP